MRRYRVAPWLFAAIAAAALALLPALAQETDTSTTTVTTTTSTSDSTTTFNQPSAVPMGQGWYAATSSVSQNAWMSRGTPWSNDLAQVTGVARAAAVDGDLPVPGATTNDTATSGNDRLATAVSQWMDPADNSLWEVRFTGVNQSMPYGGVGVMRMVDGDTGIGLRQFPRSLAYLVIEGPVDIFRNGQRMATGLNGRMMATQGIRLAASGRMLDTADVREQAIQIHLIVPEAIPNTQMQSLYVFWPNATLDLRNLSNPVALLPAEMELARSYFVPGQAVAGTREELPNIARTELVSLRDRFLARSNGTMPAGQVIFQITNDSQVPQGFYVQGPGVQERTPLLQPGETATMRVNLQPGSYRIASFFVQTPQMRDFTHWDTIVIQ